MDERELEQLFRDAPGEPPPPSFGLSDIEAGSRRATARHRVRVATAGTFAALVLAGGGFAAGGLLSGDNGTESAAQPHSVGESATSGQPGAEGERLDSGDAAQAEELSSKQGDKGSRNSDAAAASAERCEEVDRQLATALAGELPVGPDTEKPLGGFLPCEAGVRRAAHHVTDGDAAGTISVALVPKGVAFRIANEGESVLVEARARSGVTVMLLSTPDDGSSPPLEADLQRVADAIAAGN